MVACYSSYVLLYVIVFNEFKVDLNFRHMYKLNFKSCVLTLAICPKVKIKTVVETKTYHHIYTIIFISL